MAYLTKSLSKLMPKTFYETQGGSASHRYFVYTGCFLKILRCN
jgi:hypothetical protein